MALPARVPAPEQRAGGLGLFMTCSYVILTGGPAAAAPVGCAAAVLVSLLPLLGPFHLFARRRRHADRRARVQGER